jgi:hypothetical protein
MGIKDKEQLVEGKVKKGGKNPPPTTRKPPAPPPQHPNGKNKAVAKKDQFTLSPENLIKEALKNNASVEVVERLMKIRKELKEERARELFYDSLAGFQAECPEIEKTKPVYNKSRTTVLYKYAPLDQIVSAVKCLLRKYQFSYTIKATQTAQAIKAQCVLYHVAGHSETTEVEIPFVASDFMNAAQAVGSAFTYAKRYAFTGATGILLADGDDDARGADEPPKVTKTGQPEKKFSGNVAELPEENRVLYQQTIGLLRDTYDSGEPIFAKQEKRDHKINLDLAAFDLEKLKKLSDTIQKIASQR